MTQRFDSLSEDFLRLRLGRLSQAFLVLGAILLGLSFFFPLWQMHLVAPQYRDGLDLYIYAYQLEGGNDGQHLDEINLLNHYIGMRELKEADFVEMQWIPFALGIFILLSLRAAVFRRMGNVVDLFVLFSYFGLFSMANFYYRLYTYGHDLDPRAPMTIDPFVPILVGKQRIANFVQYSFPHIGSYFLMGFAVCLILAAFFSWRRKERVA